jgi:arylsulfatase A-like enzyme
MPSKPNIVLIMADDLGYGDLGCYGQQKILTPNIDKLASEGMRFTQAYAGSSVCAPSRCSLLTGFHNGNNRIKDNIPHGTFLQPDDFTIAELMKQAGYVTGGIGKYSLGNPGSWGIPIYQGFDYYYGHLNQDQAHFYYPDYLWENDEIVLLSKNRAGQRGSYTHDLFTEKALTFIENNHHRPFFLYLPYTIPHFSDYSKESPEVFSVPSDAPYTDKDWSQTAKNYAAMITRLDRDVGRIVDLVNKLGLEENTLIIFTSDNGPWQGVSTPIDFFDSNGPLRGGKREMYEGGIRVPFIAKWKKIIAAGSSCDEIIAFWDMMPTLADIIQYPIELKTDGISFLPLLSGDQNAKRKHDFLYWDYGHVRDVYMQGVRFGNYKGIVLHENNQVTYEVYDLSKDPDEKVNIADQNPELVVKTKELVKHAFKYDARYPRTPSYEY